MGKSGFKLVIFDLDGTILNTIDDISDALNKSLISLNLSPFEVEDVKYLVGSGVKVIIEKALRNKLNEKYDELKEEYYDKLYNLYNENYALCRRNKTRVYAGIKEVLKYLKYNNIKIAVFSNKPDIDVQPIIDYYFDDIKFDYVLGQTSRNNIKPSSDGIIEIERKLNVLRPNIMYVGDSEVDILTAKFAKCFSVAVSWGYRKIEELKDANVIVNSPYEIIDIIEKNNNLDKILLLNKPENISSNQIITKVKWTLIRNGYNINQIGHAGTLDPNATGLLVVLLNDATKISDYLLLNDKEYVSTVEIGKTYDTYDIWGKLIEENKMKEEDFQYVKNHIDEVLYNLIGKTNQIPPIYSSIKYHGMKLYDYARYNEKIDLTRFNREIEIFDLVRISDCLYDNDTVKFDIRCKVSKGTYIRSLAKTIGECLGYPSSMASLVRKSSGKYNIIDSYTIEDISCDNFKLINMLDALDKFIQIEVSKETELDIMNGMTLSFDSKYDDDIVLKRKNKLLGIYSFDHYNKNTNKFIYKVKRVWN